MMATATPSMEEKSCTINMPCPGGLGIQLGDEEKEGLGFITRVVEGSEAEVTDKTVLSLQLTNNYCDRIERRKRNQIFVEIISGDYSRAR